MIFYEKMKAKYPFASKFFELALMGADSRFAHGFILCGNNISYQYKMALDIARYLNCTKDKTLDCDCINCNWIRENAHPAVITISPIDYIEKPKTKISVEQIRNLRNSLGVTSPYHRVVIVTDAKEVESDFPFSAPRASSEQKDRIWTPSGLNYSVFGRSPANAMLKILEEPSDRVTFFFLTQNKDDLLPTIVSRCQSVSLVSQEPDNTDSSVVSEFLEAIPYENEAKALSMAEKWQELSKEIPPEKLLNMMQKLVKDNIMVNACDRNFALHSMELLKKFETAKLQLKSYVQPQNVAQSLFLSLKK
jgi:DNA polymerase-3 subunit delta'